MTQQDHPHMPYGRVYQTEHFDILIKRCRFCQEFMGVETASRNVVEPPVPPVEQVEEKND